MICQVPNRNSFLLVTTEVLAASMLDVIEDEIALICLRVSLNIKILLTNNIIDSTKPITKNLIVVFLRLLTAGNIIPRPLRLLKKLLNGSATFLCFCINNTVTTLSTNDHFSKIFSMCYICIRYDFNKKNN